MKIESSTWAPLRVGLFRALWMAALVSNIGSWMQTVGAQWLLMRQPHAVILVALVQTADMLPDVLLSYVGGVLADILDRRAILIASQAFLAVAGLVLTVLTYAGQMPPALLLAFTFLIGAGSPFYLPAYQAIIPDIGPRPQLQGAAMLSSVSVNLARAIGPAMAGLLVQRAGVGACFALNTASFLCFGLVAVFAPIPTQTRSRLPERFVSALHAGGRYVRHSPVIRRLLMRATVFLIPASVLWALLPLVATRSLGLGANGYGLLLGALGIGAVAGVATMRRIQAALSPNQWLITASFIYAASLVVLVTVKSVPIVTLTLLATGLVWATVLSQINAEIQLFLPGWVRARGLSIYQIVLFGAMGGGSLAWGFVAEWIGLKAAFLAAAGLLAAGAASAKLWPLFSTKGMDRSPAVYWPDPQLAFNPAPEEGPIMIQTTYNIAAADEPEFFKEMDWVRRARLRTGAVDWDLYREGETAHRFVEVFVVPSWEEHMRQHGERGVSFDRDHEALAKGLSDPPTTTLHFVAVDADLNQAAGQP
jgi:MFS family permease